MSFAERGHHRDTRRCSERETRQIPLMRFCPYCEYPELEELGTRSRSVRDVLSRVDWISLICSLVVGLVGWVVLLGALFHSQVLGGALWPGAAITLLFWLGAGFCMYAAFAPIWKTSELEETEERR